MTIRVTVTNVTQSSYLATQRVLQAILEHLATDYSQPLIQSFTYPLAQTSTSKPRQGNDFFSMSLYKQKGTPADGPDEDMCCSFFDFGLGLCAADAEKVAAEPCYYCVQQNPHVLKEAIENNFEPADKEEDKELLRQLYRLLKDMSEAPAGEFICFFRRLDQRKFDVNNEWVDNWFKELLKGRLLHNKNNNTLRFEHIVHCETVENPLELCKECVEVMREEVEGYIEKGGSRQQKKLFTEKGVLTFECMMMDRPKEEDLASLWKERFKRAGPEGCQRVLGEHQICANDYKFYRRKPGGEEVIDRYFGKDLVRRSVPAGP